MDSFEAAGAHQEKVFPVNRCGDRTESVTLSCFLAKWASGVTLKCHAARHSKIVPSGLLGTKRLG